MFLKIKKVSKSINNYSEICDTMESTKYRKYLILSVWLLDISQNTDILDKGETMKIEKKTMDYSVCIWDIRHLFFRLDFQPEYDQGKIVLG